MQLSAKAALFAFLLTGACATTNTQTADPAPAVEEASPAAQKQSSTDIENPADMMGSLSEEQFKELHLLNETGPAQLWGEDISIEGTAAYLSLPPSGENPKGGVLLIHEWWGLNDHIKHWADRLSAEGYAALAIDLYSGQVATSRDDAMRFMKGVDKNAALNSLSAAHNFLKEDPRIGAERTASIGWCFGGGWSLQHAINTPDLTAAVIYYGHLTTDPAKLEAINASVLGIFGSQDQGIPPEQVAEFQEGLTQTGKTNRILSYDAPHAFANPSSARYDFDSAEKAWKETQLFLEEKLSP